ncbi:hypothetical protein Tco_0208924, partial [Tanacetum coccineum]
MDQQLSIFHLQFQSVSNESLPFLIQNELCFQECCSSSVPADYVFAGHVLVPAGSSSSVPADYVSAGHVLV